MKTTELNNEQLLKLFHETIKYEADIAVYPGFVHMENYPVLLEHIRNCVVKGKYDQTIKDIYKEVALRSYHTLMPCI